MIAKLSDISNYMVINFSDADNKKLFMHLPR